MEEALRVLHVEDNRQLADLTATRLQQAEPRFDIEITTSPETALASVETEQFDCIVSDYDMPEMDGLEFFDCVREIDAEIPFILFTGHGSETIASEAISAGVTDYIRKETGSGQYALLAKRIENAVEQYRTRNKRKQRQKRQQEQRQALSQLINDTTVVEGEFDEAIKRITATAADVLDVDRAGIWLLDETDALYCVTEYDRRSSEHTNGRSISEEEFSNYFEAISDQRVVAIDTAGSDRRTTGIASISHLSEVRSSLDAAIRSGGELIGVVRHETISEQRSWPEDQQQFAGDIAEVVYRAYRNRERQSREEKLHEQKEKIEALHAVATDLKACKSPQEVYKTIIEAAESILEFDLAIADAAENGTLVPKAVSSTLSEEQYYDQVSIDAEDNMGAQVYRTGESEITKDVKKSSSAPADPQFRSGLTVPIGEHGILQTVAMPPEAFDETDLELAELLVTHARQRLTHLDHERQLKEKTKVLERQNDRLNEFVGVVSHDLRNPLQVAQGNLKLAKESGNHNALQVVDDALDRMDQLIEDLLTMACEGERVNDLTSIELDELTQTCWAGVVTDQATLEIETKMTIKADPQALRQLLENFFRNAVDHAGKEPTVVVGELDAEDGFYVADDGPGIPVDKKSDIFETGVTTAEEGTGFGLSIVREIADAHNWEVSVTESTMDGARFEVQGVETVES